MKKFPLCAAAGGVCALAMLTLLFARPFACIEGIRAGLASCTEQVVPALFPFFVVSSIIAASPLAKVLGAAVWPYTRFGLGIRDSRAATALLAVLKSASSQFSGLVRWPFQRTSKCGCAP